MQRRHRATVLVTALVGPASFAAAAIISGRRVPGFRHRDEPVSALASKHSGAAPIMMMGFLGLAAGSFALAGRVRNTRLPPCISPMLRISAATTALAGLTQCSDRSCPSRLLGDANATLADELHGIFSMATFVSWIAMPLVTARRGNGVRQRDRVLALTTGVAALAAWLWTGLLVRRRASRWAGAAQRVMIAAALAWHLAAAVAALPAA